MTEQEKKKLREQIVDIVKPPVPQWYQTFEEQTQLEEGSVPTRFGEVPVYFIRPKEKNNTQTLFINIHGGGFIWPHREYDTAYCRRISAQTGCQVADIDYSLAPDAPYPIAFYQCYDVVKYLITHADQFHFDPEKMIIAGSSAGANLATAVCLHAAETEEFSFMLEILLYPPTDLYTDPAIKQKDQHDCLIPPERARQYNALYIDTPEQAKEIYASPLFAPEELLRKMPDTILYTASEDALRFEGEAYGRKLIQAGVHVISKRWPNSNHGFTFFYTPEALECLERIVRYVKFTIMSE